MLPHVILRRVYCGHSYSNGIIDKNLVLSLYKGDDPLGCVKQNVYLFIRQENE